VSLEGLSAQVDTGFLVYNHRTYPKLVALFDELGFRPPPPTCRFRCRSALIGLKRGSNLKAASRSATNALRPGLAHAGRHRALQPRQARALALRAERGQAAESLDQSLGEFLAANRYSGTFRDGYLLPMAAAIWSCPMATMLAFPMGSFARFFHNHGLLTVTDRPQWHTVRGGSGEYVRRIRDRLTDVRADEPVLSLHRVGRGGAAGLALTTPRGTAQFEQVVLACQRSGAGPATDAATKSARSRRPSSSRLCTDERYAALAPPGPPELLSNGDERTRKCRDLLAEPVQPLPFRQQVLLSLNPLFELRAERATRSSNTNTDLDQAATAAAPPARHPGRRATWFAGAWTGYGFHEDGLRPGSRWRHVCWRSPLPSGSPRESGGGHRSGRPAGPAVRPGLAPGVRRDPASAAAPGGARLSLSGVLHPGTGPSPGWRRPRQLAVRTEPWRAAVVP
jgi:predicted NAD/FAD-binding protein